MGDLELREQASWLVFTPPENRPAGFWQMEPDIAVVHYCSMKKKTYKVSPFQRPGWDQRTTPILDPRKYVSRIGVGHSR